MISRILKKFQSSGINYIVCFVTCCLSGISGCDKKDLRPKNESSGETSRLFVYEHDFSLVRPGTEQSHRFDITNNSDIPWVVKEIQTNCSCTVPTITAKTIEPGKTESVDVVYRAGNSHGDDKRSIHVVMEEPGPTIRLTVKAGIREPIHVRQRDVTLETPYQQKGREYYIEVCNYGDEDWNGLKLSTEADWFTIESHKLDVLPRDAGIRESYRVVITPKAEHLKPGWYQGMLDLTGGEMIRTIPIRLRVQSKVEVRPEQLFFGIVEPNSTTTKTLLLKFRDDVRPKAHVSTDIQEMVTWKWRKQEYPNWILEVNFHAGEKDEMVDGKLTLEFSDSDIDAKIVPIKAMVRLSPKSFTPVLALTESRFDRYSGKNGTGFSGKSLKSSM